MRKILSLSINDDEIVKKLDIFVKNSHSNRSEIVKKALRQYFYLQEMKNLRSDLRNYAEKQGYFTDEDIFKVVS